MTTHTPLGYMEKDQSRVYCSFDITDVLKPYRHCITPTMPEAALLLSLSKHPSINSLFIR